MSDEEKKSRPKSKEYPAASLKQTIEFVEIFKNYPHNKPIAYELAAKECGVSSSTKSFRYTISAAKQFGLISTSTGQTFTLLESAYRLIRPTESEAALRALKIECFSTPKLYAELISEYAGKSLPSVGTIENLLVNYYQILPSTAKVAAQKFVESATEIGLVQNGVLSMDEYEEETLLEDNEDTSEEVRSMESKNANKSELQMPENDSEFAAPLNIPFGDKRRAVLYMPIDATKEDAEYAKDMIALMFKRVYKVD